jgi:hypothetical protein
VFADQHRHLFGASRAATPLFRRYDKGGMCFAVQDSSPALIQGANMNLHPPEQPPQFVMPLLRKARTWDADEHGDNLSGWEQVYDQLSPGTFASSITELWLPKTQIFVETANQVLRQSCAAWPDSIWFGIRPSR